MDTITRMLPIINEKQVEAWEKREAEVRAKTRTKNQEKPNPTFGFESAISCHA
jgi:hypothetical protein